MREYYCEVCGERIAPADIRVSVPKMYDDKVKEMADFHNICYLKFLKALDERKEKHNG